jgi:hypothetical protein
VVLRRPRASSARRSKEAADRAENHHEELARRMQRREATIKRETDELKALGRTRS